MKTTIYQHTKCLLVEMSGQVIISLTKTWVENAGAHHASRDFFMHLFISAETREERERKVLLEMRKQRKERTNQRLHTEKK
jgi:hypothetical protein